MCNINQSSQQVRKTKIWKVLLKWCRSDIGVEGGTRGREGRERKMSSGDSHIWPVCFLGFSPNKCGGENAQFPKRNLTNAGTQTRSWFFLLLTLKHKHTQSFSSSATCDQLNNVWFTFKHCNDVYCWVCAPVRVYTSIHLPCQVASININPIRSYFGTHLFYNSEVSEITHSGCKIFSTASQEMLVMGKWDITDLLAVAWYEIFAVKQDAKNNLNKCLKGDTEIKWSIQVPSVCFLSIWELIVNTCSYSQM